jgi:hypothetical protein
MGSSNKVFNLWAPLNEGNFSARQGPASLSTRTLLHSVSYITLIRLLFLLQHHRVVVPEQQHVRSKGRHSIAFFVHPDNDTPITPIECPATPTETPEAIPCFVKNSKNSKPHHTKYNTIYTAYQHLQMRFRETYAS